MNKILVKIIVVEADVCLMESDSRGHLLIAVLCFLTIQQNGLNEIDLRRLLADEHALLPMGIRRNYRNLPFDYCAECYGHTNPQILPIRWYYIINRIGHLLIAIDSDDNHFLIPAACQRIIRKKFLTKPVHLEHFQKLLTSFYSTKEKL
ncbi:unnamed protein product [Caenorhabditis angaria]|uniref:Uncharacterized protein n=1 Tax=Caenorhabditis angaria TaxID=860376 RepID=A0A9P1IPF4_9PELO|nr:unnamed protein product [Caenorhabditis angaria]